MDRRTQQYLVLGVSAVAVATVFGVVFGVLGPKRPDALANRKLAEVDVSIVEDRTAAAAPEMSWVTKSRKELQQLKEQVEELQKSLDAERAESENRLERQRADLASVFEQQALKIGELEQRLAGSREQPNRPSDRTLAEAGGEFIRPNSSRSSNTRSQAASRNTSSGTAATAPAIGFGQTFTLASLPDEPSSKTRTLRNYIPAGSYAPAIVLSGADAATNVQDRENPMPVLFRITGPAVTAAAGRRNGAKVNIVGCTVQGSAIGDLSSERVKVRLISMTCLKPGGRIMETKVAGYMVGSGKAGVRGRVISREGGLIANAAMAGALQGLGSAASNVGASDEESVRSLSDMAKTAGLAAGAGGLESAASTLADYYVKRAEQYQPVVTLNGGTNVEIVFLEGVEIDD